MDNPDDFRFLNSEVAGTFNPPLQADEYIVCQTYPKPKTPIKDGKLNVLNLLYQGKDFKRAWQIAQADNLGRDYSSAGVCQWVGGGLKVLDYRGEPGEDLAKSPDDYDYYD